METGEGLSNRLGTGVLLLSSADELPDLMCQLRGGRRQTGWKVWAERRATGLGRELLTKLTSTLGHDSTFAPEGLAPSMSPYAQGQPRPWLPMQLPRSPQATTAQTLGQ